MSDTVNTLAQLNTLFQSWTMGILGTVDYSVVRVGWMTEGQPVPKVTDDVVYIRVVFADDGYNRPVQVEYSEYDTNNANSNLTSNRGLRVTWDAYGPNSFDNASLLRDRLSSPDTETTLAASNIALVTNVQQPIRVPEAHNGQWFERTTFSAQFNELVIRQSQVSYLQTAVINTNEG